MLAVGRALMSSPRCCCSTSRRSASAPKIFDTILDTVRVINAAGTSVLIAEQNARKVLRFADYCYVLENGSVALSRPRAELLRDERIERPIWAVS